MSGQVSEPGSSTPLLKLDIDCFEELFEWLSIKDLLALRQTCKRLHKVVDYYIRTHYPSVKLGYGKFRLYKTDLKQIKQSDLISVIKHLEVFADEWTKRDIKKLNKDSTFKAVLAQIEQISFNVWGRIDGDFYDLILKWCSNLKYLWIQNDQSDLLIGTSNQWLHHHYPSLEHIELHSKFIVIDHRELEMVFELNPNIQTFTTNTTILRNNESFFLESNIKIDRLVVDVDVDFFIVNAANDLCSLLNKLYDRGFYKRVHLYCKCIDGPNIEPLTAVRGMEKFHFNRNVGDLIGKPMPDLKELALHQADFIEDLESVARNLVNLERIFMEYAEPNSIASFLRYFPKLKEIKVNNLNDDIESHQIDIVDLDTLNKERSKLKGANKVTIYVQEHVFLATKYAKTNTDLSLVKLKRAEAVKWTHQFEF